MSSGPFLQVLLDLPLASPFDYAADAVGAVAPNPIGYRCVVPLGRRKAVGIVVGMSEATALDAGRIRPVARVLDEISPLDVHWLALTRFAADYYQHGWGEVALPALPPAMRQLPGPRYIQSMTRLRASVVAAMAVGSGVDGSERRPALTSEQATAVERLADAAGFRAHLLFGVTGSGKTEVYLSAIERTLAARPDAQALLLVPEINLTPQLEAQIRTRFPHYGVVALHSGLPAGERASAWLAAHEGRARVVVGTRLAIFASLPKLSLIVVDEEHDPSYKAGEGVRYSARDLAVKRAQMLDITVVLGSATPSLESWSHARSGRYSLLTLTQRAAASDWVAPNIELVDPGRPQDASGMAPAIRAALAECLDRRESSRWCSSTGAVMRLSSPAMRAAGFPIAPTAPPTPCSTSRIARCAATTAAGASRCPELALPVATARCRASAAAPSVSKSRCSSSCLARE